MISISSKTVEEARFFENDESVSVVLWSRAMTRPLQKVAIEYRLRPSFSEDDLSVVSLARDRAMTQCLSESKQSPGARSSPKFSRTSREGRSTNNVQIPQGFR
jgi:hypothetical protein